jgi:hypothetical protein
VRGRLRQSRGLVEEGSTLNRRHDQTTTVWHVSSEADGLFRPRMIDSLFGEQAAETDRARRKGAVARGVRASRASDILDVAGRMPAKPR